MCLGIQTNKEKIGNLMVLLAERLTPLYQTKLIKLLYLIDETAIKENGMPITWLDYKVWKLGPVAPDTYDVKYEKNKFSDFIKTEINSKGHCYITPVALFNDQNFSEYELEIIDSVIKKFGKCNTQELIDYTHRDGSPWSRAKEENNIIFYEDGDYTVNTSNISIELQSLIENDEDKIEKYHEAKEMKYFELSKQPYCF